MTNFSVVFFVWLRPLFYFIVFHIISKQVSFESWLKKILNLNFQELAAMVKKRGESAVKIIKDLRRRSQLLLDKQLEHQRLLFQRLESGTLLFFYLLMLSNNAFLYLFLFFFTRKRNRYSKRKANSHYQDCSEQYWKN